MPPTIRLATVVDATTIADIYAPFCASTIVSFEEIAPSPAEMAQRISRLAPRYPWLVLEDETVAGYTYASPHRERAAYRWAVDVTVYVHLDYRRCGVGTALYTALFSLLGQQGFHRAFAGVALPNPASEKLHEAMGFGEVGVYQAVGYKLGAWRDVRWYQRALRSIEADPAEPLPVSALIGTPGWEEAIGSGLARYRGPR
jgi:phosphinothricin acetyltransferase